MRTLARVARQHRRRHTVADRDAVAGFSSGRHDDGTHLVTRNATTAGPSPRPAQPATHHHGSLRQPEARNERVGVADGDQTLAVGPFGADELMRLRQ
jgi:hypothetical protein